MDYEENYPTIISALAREKRPSLLQKSINHGQKSFITRGPGREGLPGRKALAYLASSSVTNNEVL